MSWYQPGFLDPVAAIEFETRVESIWDSEVRNLLYSAAELKVLLTYVEDSHQREVVNQLSYLYSQRRNIHADELLAIVMIYNEDEGRRWFVRWEAYVFSSDKNGMVGAKELRR